MKDSIFKCPALIGFLVKKLKEKHRKVGKTIVQKMMYLLTREKIVDFKYTMYHYGPYSFEVAGELNFAKDTGIVDIQWDEMDGYYDITPGSKLNDFENLIEEKEKKAIEKIVEDFGRFNAIEISIIATALFIKDNFKVPNKELAEKVKKLKPEHKDEYIKHILYRAKIITH